MDHKVPVARGGRSVRGNVVACCAACNRAKRALTPAERVLAALEDAGTTVAAPEEGGTLAEGHRTPCP